MNESNRRFWIGVLVVVVALVGVGWLMRWDYQAAQGKSYRYNRFTGEVQSYERAGWMNLDEINK